MDGQFENVPNDEESDNRDPAFDQETENADDGKSASENEKDEANKEKSISADLIRGHINTIILRSLADGDKYGYEIIAEIEKKSRGQYTLKQPSLYSALKRLETQGFVTSYWGGTAGGGRRKYFSLTESGQAIADQNRSEWEYSRTIIDSLISDKDFDFSNPPPSAVNMRVLKDSTTRASRRGENGEEDIEEDEESEEAPEVNTEYVNELAQRYNELLAENERIQNELSESRERESNLLLSRETSGSLPVDDEERARYQDLIRSRDELINNLDARYEALLEKEKSELTEKERERYEEMLKTEREQFQKEQDELIENIRRQYEQLVGRENEKLAEEERLRYEEIIRDRETKLEEMQARYNEYLETKPLDDDERLRYETMLSEQQEKLNEEKARLERELEEQAALYREREKEIRHQNYINLINTPPAVEETEDFDHYTAPMAQEDVQPTAEENYPEPEPVERDYRSVVDELYAKSIRAEASAPVKHNGARSLDGIDFHDIEEHAKQDGIKVVTSGKTEKTKQTESASVVHKGKALFLSALLLFFVIVAEGAVILGIKRTYDIPIAYPCVLWGIGLVVLLVTGLAYANHFGENSLRKSTPTLVNTIVIYVLSVILTLIVALAVNIDFHDAKDLACFIAIPIIYLFGIVIFGVTYYMQIKPKN